MAKRYTVFEKELSILLQQRPNTENLTVLLEYAIPRRGKRIDVVILIKTIIVVIELKTENTKKAAQLQLEDYCLDLRDFHAESANRTIIPLLVSGKSKTIPIEKNTDYVQPVHIVDKNDFASSINDLIKSYAEDNKRPIEPDKWNESEYKPTPTIIEAAKTLYDEQNVKEICRCHAGIENLTSTTEAVLNIIYDAQDSKKKMICFITGVPGSGKTLAGLNIVHNRKLHEGKLGAFLSGNGPLVKVLIEALARDLTKKRKNGKRISKKEAKREISTFIQGVHEFRNDYFRKRTIPSEHIIVFDEAQRAWNAEKLKTWLKRKNNNHSEVPSEPQLILEVMNRHSDWAVIVALIGGGQEIHSGEAGLAEWGRAISQQFSNWDVYISPFLKSGHHSTGGQALFEKVPSHVKIFNENALHLDVCIRSYRAEKVSYFVHELLRLKEDDANRIFREYLNDYPIYLTRSLRKAKGWLSEKQRGTRRIGLIASSGARRLKAFGLDVKNSLKNSDDVPNWFLNNIDDIRSSFSLEDIATEFAVQGLELDWSCVCWGADLRYSNNGWIFKNFKGDHWENINNNIGQEYLINKYRVLLTRAREGLVIWIPEGSREDDTRKPEFFDHTANYLRQCGIPDLP